MKLPLWNRANIKRIFLLAAVVFSSAPAYAEEVAKPVAIPQVSVESWRASVTPYLWALNANGSLFYGGNQLATASVGTSTLLSSLNIGGMVDAEVHKGNWGLSMDLMYASISNSASRAPANYVDLGSRTTMNQGVYTFALTYTLHGSNDIYLDVLAGARIFSVDSTTNFNVEGFPADYSKSSNTLLTDPVVGLKGRLRIADSDYFIPFYVDVGGGGGTTQITTQAYLGVGRAFDWGDVSMGVKNLYYNMKNQGATTNLDYFGGAIGVTFKF